MPYSYTITIPNAEIPEYVEAYSFGWNAKLMDGTDNPVSQVEYVKQKLLEHIKKPVIALRERAALEQANQTSNTTLT